jgi:hypothetical protein
VRRRLLVRVAPDGALTVEADGFQGKVCEAATREIEQALGQSTGRKLKPEHRQVSRTVDRTQTLGNGES